MLRQHFPIAAGNGHDANEVAVASCSIVLELVQGGG